MQSWLTSAAIVALIVSTLGFYWQRTLEHSFILRKEKRDLFREISKQMALCRRTMTEHEFYNSSPINELNELLFELDVLECRGIFTRVNRYRELLLEANLFFTENANPKAEQLKPWLKRLGNEHSHVMQAMRVDLKYTPTFFWQKLAYKRAIESIGAQSRSEQDK